jgi:hypothetical protein
VDSSIFQIGFRGVYTGSFHFYISSMQIISKSSLAVLTGQPTASALQTALNDLPTIFPLSVTVSASSTLYNITFPIEMGNVPLLTCISTSLNLPNITEIIQGISSGTKLFLSLDDQFTNPIDFITTTVTQANLWTIFNNLFSIRCPPSINNAGITPSIVYLQDFETNCIYDGTPITINAFCGQCSYIGNSLINGNTQAGNYLCFAYRLLNNYVTSIGIGVQINGDTTTTIWEDIPFSPKADQYWHYICIDINANLISESAIPASASSMIIIYAWLNIDVLNGIFIDTISIRTALPNGYDDINSYPINQSINSAIEGIRRLYPEHQLVYNTLRVQYTPMNSTIDVYFRYIDCTSPSLLVAWPNSVRLVVVFPNIFIEFSRMQ